MGESTVWRGVYSTAFFSPPSLPPQASYISCNH